MLWLIARLSAGLSANSRMPNLNPLDDVEGGEHLGLAGCPVEGLGVDLLLDLIEVEDLLDLACAVAAGQVDDAVADLGEDAEDADVAGLGEVQVVDEAVPEGLCCDS